MPNTKISALTAGDPALGTDQIPIARSGANFQVTAASIAALSPAGTVTSVGGTGTVNGLTLTGTVTSSGNLTLGGTLSGVSLTTQVTGTLPLANGGTGATTKAAAFNALSPVSATGDLIIGNGVNSNTRLAIGSFNQYLRSNGTTASWANVSVSASDIAGTLQPYQGGTGTSSSPTSNGQLLIGNGFGGYNVNTLTAGAGVTITNGSGTITVAASGGGGGPTINVLGVSTSSGPFNNSPPSSSTSKPLIGYNVTGFNYGAFYFKNFSTGYLVTSTPIVNSVSILDSTGTSTSYMSGLDFNSTPNVFSVYDSTVTCYGLQITNAAMQTLFSDSKAAITSPSVAPFDASSGFSPSNPQISVSTSGPTYANSGGYDGITVNKVGSDFEIRFGSGDFSSASPTVFSISFQINGTPSSYSSGIDFSVSFAGNSSFAEFAMLISPSNPTLTTLLTNSFL